MPPNQQKPTTADSPEVCASDSTRFRDEIAKDRRFLENEMSPWQWQASRTRAMGGIILPRPVEEIDHTDCGH